MELEMNKAPGIIILVDVLLTLIWVCFAYASLYKKTELARKTLTSFMQSFKSFGLIWTYILCNIYHLVSSFSITWIGLIKYSVTMLLLPHHVPPTLILNYNLSLTLNPSIDYLFYFSFIFAFGSPLGLTASSVEGLFPYRWGTICSAMDLTRWLHTRP